MFHLENCLNANGKRLMWASALCFEELVSVMAAAHRGDYPDTVFAVRIDHAPADVVRFLSENSSIPLVTGKETYLLHYRTRHLILPVKRLDANVVTRWLQREEGPATECALCLEDFEPESEEKERQECLQCTESMCVSCWHERRLVCPYCGYKRGETTRITFTGPAKQRKRALKRMRKLMGGGG